MYVYNCIIIFNSTRLFYIFSHIRYFFIYLFCTIRYLISYSRSLFFWILWILKSVFGEWVWHNSFVPNWTCMVPVVFGFSFSCLFVSYVAPAFVPRMHVMTRETIVRLYNRSRWEWCERMPHCSPSWLRNVALLTFDAAILLFGSCLPRWRHLRNLQTWHLASVVTNSLIPRCRFYHDVKSELRKYVINL